jgi:hypothetical protein
MSRSENRESIIVQALREALPGLGRSPSPEEYAQLVAENRRDLD